jgi:predicted  nucleic acid-binding Zn-ribbon protein
MHKCAKCGRAATSLEEIDAGCPCGSKVFKFDRQSVANDAAAQEGKDKVCGQTLSAISIGQRPMSESSKAELSANCRMMRHSATAFCSDKMHIENCAGNLQYNDKETAGGGGAGKSGGNGALGGVNGAANGGAGGGAGGAALEGSNGATDRGARDGGNGAQEGKVPESYLARTSFTGEDIENIKVLTQGVFLLDVRAIAKNPVVLKDEDEIYYVKLPLEQKKPLAAPAQPEGGSGKK